MRQLKEAPEQYPDTVRDYEVAAMVDTELPDILDETFYAKHEGDYDEWYDADLVDGY